MREKQSEQRRYAFRIATLAAVLTIVATIIVKYFYVNLHWDVLLISPITIFGWALVFFYWRYDCTWEKRNRNHSLLGVWGYWVHDEQSKQTKIGYFRIEQDDFGIEIREGESRLIENGAPKLDVERVSWKAKLCTYNEIEHRLLLHYEGTAMRSDSAGALKLNTPSNWFWLLNRMAPMDKPPQTLKGYFAAAESEKHLHKGQVVARRIWPERLDSLAVRSGEDWKKEVIAVAFADCEDELKEHGYLPSRPSVNT